jgi:hypothetical protein
VSTLLILDTSSAVSRAVQRLFEIRDMVNATAESIIGEIKVDGKLYEYPEFSIESGEVTDESIYVGLYSLSIRAALLGNNKVNYVPFHLRFEILYDSLLFHESFRFAMKTAEFVFRLKTVILTVITTGFCSPISRYDRMARDEPRIELLDIFSSMGIRYRIKLFKSSSKKLELPLIENYHNSIEHLLCDSSEEEFTRQLVNLKYLPLSIELDFFRIRFSLLCQ